MAIAPIVIRTERPDQPDVLTLLAELDSYLGSLYEPEANHILDVAALRTGDVTFLTARQDERLVGCGAVRRMPAAPETDGLRYGEIKRMIVLPAMRGQRIGERLLTELELKLQREGIQLALLETGELQTAAVRLYERCGYSRRATFGGYPDNGLSAFFEKRLLP